MTDLVTLAEWGAPVAAIGGGALYARHAHPVAYWSTVGLPLSVARLPASYSSTVDACGLTVPPSRWRALAVKATTRREIRPMPPRRGMIRPTSTGLWLRLRLAPGQKPADVAAEKAALIYQHSDDERQQEVAAGLDATVRKARQAAREAAVLDTPEEC